MQPPEGARSCFSAGWPRRSTARLSSGQRTALNDVIEAHTEERSGQTFYVYEHTSQVSMAVGTPVSYACESGAIAGVHTYKQEYCSLQCVQSFGVTRVFVGRKTDVIFCLGTACLCSMPVTWLAGLPNSGQPKGGDVPPCAGGDHHPPRSGWQAVPVHTQHVLPTGEVSKTTGKVAGSLLLVHHCLQS